MAKSRYVNTAFWDDDYTGNLDPSEKLIFLYLLTNPNTNMAGIYQVPLKRMAVDTGYDQEMVKKILSRFERDGKAYYEIGWIVIKNFGKHQTYNPSTARAVANFFNALPEWLRVKLLDEKDPLYVDFDKLLGAYGQAVDRVRHNLNLNSNLNLNLNLNPNAGKPAKGGGFLDLTKDEGKEGTKK